MVGAHLDVQLGVPHRDAQAASPHRLDMGRPLVDQGDVEAGIDQVRGDATAVGAGPEHCDLVVHPPSGNILG